MQPTVETVMRRAHTDEVTEIQDTDAFVAAIVRNAIEMIETCGRTLPTPRIDRHRYSELVECLRDAASDGMPAPREENDDPFM